MQFLGGFHASLDGEPLTTFESSKVRALLAYLAVESQRPHPRESLAALLWPDWPDSAARSNLRYALSDLRKVIGDREAKPPFLLISREAIQFNTGCDHRLDVAEFSVLVAVGEGDGVQRLEQGFALYHNQFLEGFSVSDASPFEDWLRLKREQLNRCYMEALHRLAAELEMATEYERALSYAYRLVDAEPLDESGHRQVMRLLAFSGRGAEALAQYETCRGVLVFELGALPSYETEALYQLLLGGELPPLLSEIPPPARLLRLGQVVSGVRRTAAQAARTRRLVYRRAAPGGAALPQSSRGAYPASGARDVRDRAPDPVQQAGRGAVLWRACIGGGRL